MVMNPRGVGHFLPPSLVALKNFTLRSSRKRASPNVTSKRADNASDKAHPKIHSDTGFYPV